MAKARAMTADDAERARATKAPTGKDADAAKLALDALNEMGLTNVLGVALPDTRNLSSERARMVIEATWAIRKATVDGGEGLWAALDSLVLPCCGAPAPRLPRQDGATCQESQSNPRWCNCFFFRNVYLLDKCL